MWVVCEIPAFENVCPSKTPESFSWVLLGAGEEEGVLMWYGFLGVGGLFPSFLSVTQALQGSG